MGKKSPPPAPDYTAAAEKQADASKDLTTQQTFANRPDIYTPWGSQTWQSMGGIDPATGEPVTNWFSEIQLSPEQQKALDDQMAIQSGRSDAALGMLGRATDALGQPLDYSGLVQGGDRITAPSLTTTGPTGWDPSTTMQGDPASWAQNAQMQNTAGDWRQRAQDALLQFQAPLHQQAQSQLESQLANMGLTRGSEAWNSEMRGLQDRQARDQLQAFDSGRQEAQMLFNQDLAASQFGNQARNTQFQQDLARSQFGNQAAAQGFNQDLAASQFGNQALMQQLQGQQGAGNYNQMLRQQQLTEMLGQRSQPLNELNALLTGQQVNSPQMPSYSQAGLAQTPQYMQAAQNQYQASLDAYNAQQMGMGSVMGGLFGLGSAALGNPLGLGGLFKF